MGDAPARRPTIANAGPAGWLPWLSSLVLVPLLIALFAMFWPRPTIERDLTDRSVAALVAAGFTSADVTVDGRDVRVGGVPAGQARRALDVVRGVAGVRVATAPAGTTEPVHLTLTGGQLVVLGTVPNEATRRAVLAAVGDRRVVDRLAVRRDATLPGDAATIAALAAAVRIAGAGSTLVWAEAGVTLTGPVVDAGAGAAAEQAVRAALPHTQVRNQLTVAGPPPVDKRTVQADLDALVIGFLPDSPRLTPAGSDTLARVAQVLRAAPGVRVELGGHAAVAPGTAAVAQRLSDARAAVVRDALVAAGVPAAGLTPRGYADTRPKSDPVASRRVEITVL